MTTAVDDDFREFVAARWPELESLALVVVLDPEHARAVTADALAGLSRQWQDTVDAGRPGEQARRAVLHAAVTAATSTTATSTTDRGADVTSWSNLSQGGVDGDPVDPVVAALVDVIRSAPPIERAVLSGSVLWGCGTDEVARLLDRDGGSVAEHAASLDHRLTAAHDAARAAAGQEPAPWSREHDVAAAVDEILRGLSDPPDPAALVADRATGLRRRTLLAGGVAVAALAGVGAALVRRGADEPPTSARPTVARLAPDDPRWGSVDRWPPRGPLAADPAVAALVGRSADPRDRVLWAGDVDAQRVVLALTYTGNVEEDGTINDVSYSEPFLRAYQGPRGMDPALMRVVALTTGGTIGTTEVVSVTLPGGQDAPQQSLLLVLARPTLRTAFVSNVVRPLPSGTMQRTWATLTLEEGVSATTLDTPLPLATQLRVGSWEGRPDSFTESYRTIMEGPTPSTSPAWAETHISALTGIPVSGLSSTVFVDAEVPRGLFDWPPPTDAVPARLVSLLTTTPDGAVIRTSAYYDEDFVAPIEPAHLLTAATQRDPLVVWASDEREGVARFLVAAPGADRVQLISTSPDGYPVSKVVRTRGKDAVIVPVVNGADAGEYRVIARDAEGRVLFDGVPNPGRYLLDT